MKTICFVLGNYYKYTMGGAEIQAYYIARRLTKDNDVHYVFIENPRLFSNITFEKHDNKITLHVLKRYNHRIFGRGLFLNFFELRKLFNDINPDLIYQRSGNAHTGIAASWSKKYGKKMVFGISSDNDCTTKGILDLNKNFLAYPSKILNYYFSIYGIKKVDQIICQTYHQKKLLEKNFSIKAMVIPNAHSVPIGPFKKSYPLIVSWIANIKPLKKLEVFIKLAEKCKDLNVKFVYVGRMISGSYSKMLIEKTKKSPDLKYLGEINFQNANELLSKSSLFINTSSTEGFPNTYIQAWMRETPVITLNCDPDNIIKTQKIGFHSSSFDQMVKDVRFLIENDDERIKMGNKARDYAIKNHDIENNEKKYIKVFKRLMQ